MKGLPVGGKADIVVFGSGPAGISAAIAARRKGADVILVERFPFVGGMSTLVPISMWPVVTAIEIGELETSYDGFPAEILDRMETLGGLDLRTITMDGIDTFVPDPTKNDRVASSKWYIYDPEMLKYLYFEMLDEAGVELLVNTLAVETVVRDGRIEGVVVENLMRREMIEADVVIDATGSADIAARSDSPADLGHYEHDVIMPTSTTWRIAGVDTENLNVEKVSLAYEETRAGGGLDVPLEGLCMHIFSKGVVQIFGTRVFNINPLDPRQAAHGEKEQRRQIHDITNYLKKGFPEFRDARLIDTGAMMGMIGTRRIRGDYWLTQDDVLEGKKFDDVIATGTYRMEIWDLESAKNFFHHLIGTWYTIPYRSLMPQGLENVIVAGSCISGQYEAMAAWAIQPVCMLTGQAAGTAAVMCAAEKKDTRSISIPELQKQLKEDGVFLGVV